MNKAVALGLCAVLVCSLTACGTGTGSAPTTSEALTTAETPSQTETAMDTTEDTNDETTGQNMETVGTESSSEDGSILIAYFSRVGNTDFADGVNASSSASIQLNGDEIAGNRELIADSFLEEYDFSDKTVIPFCTSGGSGINGSLANINQ